MFGKIISISCVVCFSQTILASTLFDKPIQTSPLATMQSMIDLGRDCVTGSRESCRSLTKLCDEDGDSDVWNICYIGGAEDKVKEYADEYFSGISIGAAVENGDRAIVHYMFNIEDEWRHEYMNMRLIDGKWFLNSQ